MISKLSAVFSPAEDMKEIQKSSNHLVITVTTHAQDIKMLTVLELCALEYGARALLARSARQMSSTLIEDIGVSAACSYQWCRVGFFLIYSFSLLLESALIIRLSCHSFAFQVLRLGGGMVAVLCLRRTLQGLLYQTVAEQHSESDIWVILFPDALWCH